MCQLNRTIKRNNYAKYGLDTTVLCKRKSGFKKYKFDLYLFLKD